MSKQHTCGLHISRVSNYGIVGCPLGNAQTEHTSPRNS